MNPPLPPPSWLRTFEAAARNLSFTRAAAELHVTQSAVSQQIRLLEDRLGETLFQRLPQSLQLTEAGKAYLPVVHDAFDRLKLGTEELFGASRTSRVTIRSTPGFGEFWLTPRLHELLAQHPGIDLRVTSSIWNDEFMDSGVELEVRYGTGPCPGLQTAWLTQEHLVPVCSPAVAERLAGDPGNLAHERLLHTDGFRNGWPEWLQRARVARQVDGGGGCHFDTAILPLNLAEAGAGVALGRRSLIEGGLASGRLVQPFDITLPTDEAFFLAWPGDTELRAEAATVRDWLLETAGASPAD